MAPLAFPYRSHLRYFARQAAALSRATGIHCQLHYYLGGKAAALYQASEHTKTEIRAAYMNMITRATRLYRRDEWPLANDALGKADGLSEALGIAEVYLNGETTFRNVNTLAFSGNTRPICNLRSAINSLLDEASRQKKAFSQDSPLFWYFGGKEEVLCSAASFGFDELVEEYRVARECAGKVRAEWMRYQTLTGQAAALAEVIAIAHIESKRLATKSAH